MQSAQRTERQRQKAREDCQIAVLLIGSCLLVYVFIFTSLSDYLWHSYVESSCFVLNSTVIERAWCTQNQCTPKSDAVWHLNVHSKQLNFTEYLADIRQDFDVYYEASEYILTHHLAGTHERCYVHSNNKYDIRWTKSYAEGIVSAIFGIITVFFLITMITCIRYVHKEFCYKQSHSLV